ncbi:MAG: FecR domain-containing protein [Aggregatilineales bacterium]
MIRKIHLIVLTVLILFVFSIITSAQNEFAATLEVISPGVEVQRVNTSNPIPVSVEAIVGVGDIIRTDASGEARITFFADGTDVLLEPDTEYSIVEFEGDDDDFRLNVSVLAGQATHRLNRVLGTNSAYDVTTPGMTLAARGTVFTIRVEDSGRSAMLTEEGTVMAETPDGDAAVEPNFGVRSEVDAPLSDVVYATNFDELDAALDGCSASLTTPDDVSLNVRLGPAVDQLRIGTIAAPEINTLVGISESGNWYRIDYRGGFAWVLSTSVQIGDSCAGLRVFPDTQVENIDRFESLGDPVDLESLPEATAEPDNG